MLEKSNDATLLKHSPTNTPFSIDSLLDKTKGMDMVPVKPPRPSLSLPGLPGGPLIHPSNLLLPLSTIAFCVINTSADVFYY